MAYFHGIQILEPSVQAALPLPAVGPVITSLLTAFTLENAAWSMQLAASGNASFAKRAGADSASFSLIGTTLSLPPQDFEAGRTALSCNLVAMDAGGNTTDFTVVVTIGDVDDTMPTITSPATGAVLEDVAYATTLTANEVATFSKRAGADSASFVLVGNILTLGPQDYEAGKIVFACNLRATDLAGNVTDFVHTVTILDGTEATLALAGPLLLVTAAAIGTLVATITGVPIGVTPKLVPNDGRLVVAGDAATGWRIEQGATLTSAGTIGITVSAIGAVSAFAIVTVIADRVAEITRLRGNRPAVVEQSYANYVAVDASDSNTHPHFMNYSHNAVKSGAWNDPSVWDTGTVPHLFNPINVTLPNGEIISVGTAVVNSAGFDVVITSDASFKDWHCGGTGRLRIEPPVGQDIQITCDTLMMHGQFVCGSPAAPIAESRTAGKPRVDFRFVAQEPPLATTRLGLMTMGPVRIEGADKADRLLAADTIAAGASSVTLTGAAGAHWRVGDKILFIATEQAGAATTDPHYTGPASFYGPTNADPLPSAQYANTGFGSFGFRKSQDEVRTITSIVGDVVSFDAPLAFAHKRYEATLKDGQHIVINPPVASLTRSIRFRSADPTVRQKRAHMMFMFDDDVQCRHAEALDMARTDTDPTLARIDGGVTAVSNGGAVITDPLNVRGRYAWHIHGTGSYFGRKTVVFENLTAWAPTTGLPQPGWAITQHNARAVIDRCVVYNVRGAAIVSENGNEIGQWIGNTAAWVRGDGYSLSWGTRAERWENHNGHAGIAFENQSRAILQQKNIASSSNVGWMYLQQNVNMLKRIPDGQSMRLLDPITQGAGDVVLNKVDGYLYDNDSYGIEQAQIPDFDDNITYGCHWGFAVSHRQYTDRSDPTPMLSRRFHNINTNVPFRLTNYTNTYAFYDYVWIGTGAAATMAAYLGPVSWQFMFVNGYIKDFPVAWSDEGNALNYDGFWIDNIYVNVPKIFNGWKLSTTRYDTAEAHPAFGVMGPWADIDNTTPANGFTATLRQLIDIDSATQLPQPYPIAPFGYGGVEPAPGTPKPYFWLDPASPTTVAYGPNPVTLPFKGAIVDSVGVRRLGDNQNAETDLTVIGVKEGRGYGLPPHITPTQLLLRNGCWLDGATWKTPLWMVSYERLKGTYFPFRIDVALTGFPNDLLVANTIDPAQSRPVLPLVPEYVQPREIAAIVAPPVITSSAAILQVETLKLRHVLRCNEGQARWTIVGGADAARFTLSKVAGVTSLLFVGDVAPDFEAPTDVGADNVYQLTVRATAPRGVFTEQAITVTVQNKDDAIVAAYAPTLNYGSGNYPFDLANDPAWFPLAGPAGSLRATAANSLRTNFTTGPVVLMGPDTGAANHYFEARTQVYQANTHLAVRLTDADNYIGLAVGPSTKTTVYTRIAGVEKTVATLTFSVSGGQLVRIEIVGNVVNVYRAGVLVGSTPALTELPPASTRFGFVMVDGNNTDAYIFKDLKAGAVAP